MLDRVPTAVANGGTIGGQIRLVNGFVLARAVHAVLYGEKLGEAEHQRSAVLLLASGAHINTGRPYAEVAEEVTAANDEARYMKQAMEHILAGVQVHELRMPDDGDSTGLFPLPKGDIAGGKDN